MLFRDWVRTILSSSLIFVTLKQKAFMMADPEKTGCFNSYEFKAVLADACEFVCLRVVCFFVWGWYSCFVKKCFTLQLKFNKD